LLGEGGTIAGDHRLRSAKAGWRRGTGWSGFLKHLKERGLPGVWLITSDACMGFRVEAMGYRVGTLI
jgi:hypothetical protein